MTIYDVLCYIKTHNSILWFRPENWSNTGKAFFIHDNKIICNYENNSTLNDVNLLLEKWVFVTPDLVNTEKSCNY